MTDIEQHDSVEVFVGVDVGKGAHHAVALDRKGKRLLDSALPNDEAIIHQQARDALHGSAAQAAKLAAVPRAEDRGSQNQDTGDWRNSFSRGRRRVSSRSMRRGCSCN